MNIECKCQTCGQPFIARTADRKRGWARFCSKSCKAREQESRTGQFAAYQARNQEEPPEFTDAHLFDHSEWDSDSGVTPR